MKTNENIYICEICNNKCSKLFGDNVNGRYVERCESCAFKRK